MAVKFSEKHAKGRQNIRNIDAVSATKNYNHAHIDFWVVIGCNIAQL